ncbi:IclR family transcriptional regulator [Orrella marina]|nr:IclR family transcriptional regulator [Orrella marina]
MVPEDDSELSVTRSSTVKSAQRVLEILELFDRVQRPMSLTELARRLSYPVPSALALLKCLQSMEYVFYDPVGKLYTPTMRVCMLGDWLHGQIFQDGAVIALMSDLQQKTGETVMLAMQNDIFSQYVHTMQSRRALRYFLRPGSLRPIHRSATGKMLLAQMTELSVLKMLKRINSRVPTHERIEDPDAFMKEIDQIRTAGYAYNDQFTDGAAAIAVVLPVPEGMASAVLGLGGPSQRIQIRISDLVKLMHNLIETHIEPNILNDLK